MNKKIWTAALAVCLCALLLLSACGSKEGTETVSGDEAETKALTLAASGESDVLASIYMGTDNMPTIKLVYDTLVKYENGEFVPSLAESWEFSDDGKTLTFQLRAGVKFHDGTACDAEAVKANLEYKQNNPGFMALKAITAIQSIEVVDETTLIIHYPAPYYAYLADFCWPDVMIIVSPTVFIEGDYMNFSGISGTGPYAFDHRESGQYTRFVRNEDYWGDAPYYDEIIVKYIPESTSRIQALQNGEIDMIFGSALLSYDEYVQVTAMDGMAGQISESDTRVRDLVVNASRPLLTDLKVRQAIAYAIDKESLSENLTYGYEKAAELPFTEDSPYMDIVLEQTYSYDQEQSNLLLDEAGWVMNDSTGIREKDGQSLSLVLTLDSAYGSFDHSVATVIKDQLSKVGIEVSINGMEKMDWMNGYMAGEFDLTLWPGNYAFANPNCWFNPMSSMTPQTPALMGLSDSQEFLDAIAETTVTDDEERLTELFTYLYNYDIGNVIDIPLNYYKDVIVYNSEKIAGYEFDSAPCFFDVERLTPQ